MSDGRIDVFSQVVTDMTDMTDSRNIETNINAFVFGDLRKCCAAVLGVTRSAKVPSYRHTPGLQQTPRRAVARRVSRLPRAHRRGPDTARNWIGDRCP
ncbi:hypothetical protein TM4_gp71 [Mycobacterium phage TM4]|uniref:hypothetical protein n=1 Tax=Mycobacterium phage TM4 TaxID=88870 RepID=UPI000009BE86|nr:hypothetical protein TM4_gp71 [Mycobacterium phage TM4]